MPLSPYLERGQYGYLHLAGGGDAQTGTHCAWRAKGGAGLEPPALPGPLPASELGQASQHHACFPALHLSQGTFTRHSLTCHVLFQILHGYTGLGKL